MRDRVEAHRLFNRTVIAGLACLCAAFGATTASADGWAVGANGLVIKSVDAGTSWTASNPVVQTLNGVHFVSDDVGWAVGANGAIAKTIDGGDHWSLVTPTTRTLNDVFFIDETHGWAVGSYGAVLRTTNGGDNWTASSPTTAELYGVHFFDQNTGWAVGAGITLRTTNGGANWTSTFPTTSTLKSVFFVNATTGWAVGSSGVVLKTVNGGVSWTVSTATSVGLNSVRFVNANVGFAVGASGAVLKTIDGGADWTEQHPVPGELNAVFFIDAMNGWAVGVNGVQIKTTNAGELWEWSTPAAVELNDIFFASVAYLEITVQTSPAGRSYSVDGIDYTSAQTFNWFAGDPHVIATTTPQVGVGTRYLWTGWSDAGAISHVVAPLADVTYTASFDTQYQLTMNASTGGTVTPPTGWRDPGEVVTITATPDVAYDFIGWVGVGSGSYTGPNNPTTVTMNGPVTQTANFDPQMLVTVATDPSGRSITVDGADYTSPRSFAWLPGSLHTIGVSSPQATGGSRYTWTTWSDGGAQSHSVTPNADITYTASFSTEYLLTMQSSAGGSVVPATTWRAAGEVVNMFVAPDSGYVFAGWTGTGSGSYTGPDSLASVTMNGPITQSASFHQEGFPGTPTALALLGNAPNPFSDQTEIRVGLPRAADVTFDVFDVRGQRVFSERKSGVPSGWSTFTFRTANSTGGSLASGIYFLRVTSIGQVQSQRLVVIR